MRPAISLVLAAGCSFSPAITPDGGSGSEVRLDAPVMLDADASCAIQPTGSVSPSTTLGEIDVGMDPPLTCNAGDVVVGFAFYITPSNAPGWNERVAKATRVICGHITHDRGAFHTARTTMTDSPESSCINWSAGVLTPETTCPDGQVVVGVSGNEAKNAGATAMFDNISIQCAALDSTFTPVQPSTSIAVPNSSTNTDRPDVAACPDGFAATSVEVYRGCGEDALVLQCAALACM